MTVLAGCGGEGGCAGVHSHTPSWENYFKIMQFLTRNGVYTPNFGLNIRIHTPFVKFLKLASDLFQKSAPGLRMLP